MIKLFARLFVLAAVISLCSAQTNRAKKILSGEKLITAFANSDTFPIPAV